MATSRNVWLPGAAVWACLPNSSEPLSSSAPAAHISVKSKSKNARCHDRERHDDLPEKRRKAAVNPSASLDSGPEVERLPNKLAWIDTEADAPDVLLTTERKEVTMCAICLGNIEESRRAVLKWCMHQFCTHCIEEWSRVRRLCPLCKAEYHGWYYGVQSISKFEERILPPIAELSTRENNTAASQAFSRFHVRRDVRRQGRGRGRMPPRRQGEAAPSSSRRSDPFPTQRTFGLPRQYQGAELMRVLEEQAAAKALEWRQSIYNRNLIARPFELRKELTDTKDAEAERRLEPWVRRELQAVLPNSDHNFLVRLVLGLWFRAGNQAMHKPETPVTSVGPSTRNTTRSIEAENLVAKAMKELKQFFGDKTEVFWHELRCFAESPFTMQAYDTVVVYNRRDVSQRPVYKVERKSLHRDRSRRGSESAISKSTSMPLGNEDTARLENNHEIFRAGRHTVPHTCAAEGVRSSLVQQQQDCDRDRLPTCNFRGDQRRKYQRIDVLPIAEHRWQLSYC